MSDEPKIDDEVLANDFADFLTRGLAAQRAVDEVIGEHTEEGDATDRITWYKRRIQALEQLLSCYRIDRRPSEKLHLELEATRRHVDHLGRYTP